MVVERIVLAHDALVKLARIILALRAQVVDFVVVRVPLVHEAAHLRHAVAEPGLVVVGRVAHRNDALSYVRQVEVERLLHEALLLLGHETLRYVPRVLAALRNANRVVQTLDLVNNALAPLLSFVRTILIVIFNGAIVRAVVALRLEQLLLVDVLHVDVFHFEVALFCLQLFFRIFHRHGAAEAVAESHPLLLFKAIVSCAPSRLLVLRLTEAFHVATLLRIRVLVTSLKVVSRGTQMTARLWALFALHKLQNL